VTYQSRFTALHVTTATDVRPTFVTASNDIMRALFDAKKEGKNRARLALFSFKSFSGSFRPCLKHGQLGGVSESPEGVRRCRPRRQYRPWPPTSSSPTAAAAGLCSPPLFPAPAAFVHFWHHKMDATEAVRDVLWVLCAATTKLSTSGCTRNGAKNAPATSSHAQPHSDSSQGLDIKFDAIALTRLLRPLAQAAPLD